MEQENKLAKETTVLVETYTLPDGREIKVIIDTLSARTKMFGISNMFQIGAERFEAPEALFQPHLVDIEKEGLAELLFNAIQVCYFSRLYL